MFDKFQAVIRWVIDGGGGQAPLAVPVREQFHRGGRAPVPLPEALNAGFLLALSGDRGARTMISDPGGKGAPDDPAAFLAKALELIEAEIKTAAKDQRFADALMAAAGMAEGETPAGKTDGRTALHRLFFPEGLGLPEYGEELARDLRRKRRVTRLTDTGPVVRAPWREVLFTANVLVGLPLADGKVPDGLRPGVDRVRRQPQKYWYDHPVPLGVDAAANEVLHGVRGLAEAVRFEAARGRVPARARVPLLLSVSGTHEGIEPLARSWLAGELTRSGVGGGLDVSMVTEQDTVRMLAEVLLPAARSLLDRPALENLEAVFGVAGEYGRHYTFLKAVAALWQLAVEPDLKGTFKIDLDQVFPQAELVRQTGRSAFEHLCSPLWGARGVDDRGELVELGMLAGALVNEADIERGIFTADVSMPAGPESPEHLVFFSRLPQALSTEAEMMTRYGDHDLDGTTSCLQRVHVTGGTTGILVDSLRRHRPFTPTWVGRAEDQAYLLSTFLSRREPALRYAHVPGLVMRHDKDSFAREAVEAARVGKYIGDLVRIIVFTAHARALPRPLAKIKDLLDPFTGCFLSAIPYTVAVLRLSLRAAGLYQQGTAAEREEADATLQQGLRRISAAHGSFLAEPDRVARALAAEAAGWSAYYDLLDALEAGIRSRDPAAMAFRDRAAVLIRGWRL